MNNFQFNDMLIVKHIEGYLQANKKDKSKILDEIVKMTNMHRKSIIRSIRGRQINGRRKRGGSKKIYLPESIALLEFVWGTNDYICAERLISQISDTLKVLDKYNYLDKFSDSAKEQVKRMSLGTIKRIISTLPRSKSYTERNTSQGELKKKVPIRTNFNNVRRVGYFGVDFVDHNGGNCSGKYARTMCFTEVRSQWISRSATKGRDRLAVEESTITCLKKIPVHVYEFHSDNESNLLLTLLKNLSRSKKITVTRSRSYQSEDNGHVEQKNGDKIRNLVGYFRIDDDKSVKLLKEVYDIDDLYQNHFIASQRLIKKEYNVLGKLRRKIYDEAKTPYRRILEDKTVNSKIKMTLMQDHSKLDPIKLRINRDKLIKRLWSVR